MSVWVKVACENEQQTVYSGSTVCVAYVGIRNEAYAQHA